jgi:hypothetical protein
MFFGARRPRCRSVATFSSSTPTPSARSVRSRDLGLRQVDFGLVVGGGLEIRWPQSAMALRRLGGVRSVLEGADVRIARIVLTLTF